MLLRSVPLRMPKHWIMLIHNGRCVRSEHELLALAVIVKITFTPLPLCEFYSVFPISYCSDTVHLTWKRRMRRISITESSVHRSILLFNTMFSDLHQISR